MLEAHTLSWWDSTHYVFSGVTLTHEVQGTVCEAREHFDDVLQEAHLDYA